MRTIDGIRYISAGEYAKMKGITPGRVSQLKAELPFVRFEELGVELINFELIELSDVEKELAQTMFQTATPIHTMTTKDLAIYFGKLIKTLTESKGAADIQVSHWEDKSKDLAEKLSAIEAEKLDLAKKLEDSVLQVRNMGREHSQVAIAHNQLSRDFDYLKADNQDLIEQQEARSKEHQDLKSIHIDTQHKLEIKIVENNALISENEGLKSRVAALELSHKNGADLMERFIAFQDVITKKIS